MAAVVSDDSGKGAGSPTGTQKDDGAGIGETLRLARERRGLTLEQLSRETKIPLRHLDALEHDNPAVLPGPFYQRAQIRTYARALKLDPNLVMGRLERGPTPAAAVTPPAASPGVDKPVRSRHQAALIAAGVVLTALVLWRTMPRTAPLDEATQLDQSADSIVPDMPPPEDAVTRVAVGIHRAEFEQTPQPSAPRERLPFNTEPAEPRRAIEAEADQPALTKPEDARPPAGVATELIVASDPPGARVTVDGIGWGLTPVTIRHLPPGSKRLRVSKDGYATTERTISVVEGQRKTADIPLSLEP